MPGAEETNDGLGDDAGNAGTEVGATAAAVVAGAGAVVAGDCDPVGEGAPVDDGLSGESSPPDS